MKGRRCPPPFVAITRVNPTLEEMLAAQSAPGVYMLEYRHDDTCKTITSQRPEDCTCLSVDHVLLKYQAGVR